MNLRANGEASTGGTALHGCDYFRSHEKRKIIDFLNRTEEGNKGDPNEVCLVKPGKSYKHLLSLCVHEMHRNVWQLNVAPLH